MCLIVCFPSRDLNLGKGFVSLICSGRWFQSLIVLGKKEYLWLSTLECGIGKLRLLLWFLVRGGSTSQTRSSRGSSMDLDFALWRRWSLVRALRVVKGGQLRRSRFFRELPWDILKLPVTNLAHLRWTFSNCSILFFWS